MKYMIESMNGGEGTNLLCRKIPNNSCKFCAFKEEDVNSSLGKCGLDMATSFQRVPSGKGEEKSNFTVEKSDEHHLSQVIKVNISSAK